MLFTLYIWSSASAQPATDSYLKQFQCVAAKAGGSNTEISGNVLPSMPQAGQLLQTLYCGGGGIKVISQQRVATQFYKFGTNEHYTGKSEFITEVKKIMKMFKYSLKLKEHQYQPPIIHIFLMF